MWQVLATVAVGAAVYKVIQAATDEEFRGRRFPKSFVKEMIDEHWRLNRGWCPVCGRQNLRKKDLSVDHRVSTAGGGLNSRQNAWVICLRCNQKKGARVSLWDRFVGRGGR